MAATRERQRSAESDGDKDSGGKEEQPSGRGTAALVVAAAGVGALAGIRAMRKRRPSPDDEGEDDRDSASPDKAEDDRDDGAEADPASGTFRGMAITVLEAALDGLKEVGDKPDPAASANEDEDDDEDEEPEEPEGEDGDGPPEDDEPGGPEAFAEDGVEDEDEDADEEEGEDEDEDEETVRGRADSRNGHETELGTPTRDLIDRASRQLAELVGRQPEGVSRCEHDGGGWNIALDVVELERIPHSTDVLATYEVMLDDEGRLLEYARARRYVRSRAEELMA